MAKRKDPLFPNSPARPTVHRPSDPLTPGYGSQAVREGLARLKPHAPTGNLTKWLPKRLLREPGEDDETIVESDDISGGS